MIILLDVNCTKWMGKRDMTCKMVRSVTAMGVRRRSKSALAVTVIMMMVTASAAYGAFFDTAGKSAATEGMGEVFMVAQNDVASYWNNPASLSRFERRQASLSYGLPMSTISDLNISQVNFVTPLGSNMGLGLGVSYGGIDIANDMVISGGYGISLSEKFSIGGNVKLMRWSFDGQPLRGGTGTDEDLSKMSFSLDLSAMYRIGALFGLGEFTTGAYVKDAIMPNISKSGDDGGKLPVEFGGGLMMRRNTLAVEADVAYKDGNTIFRGGLETGVTDSNLKLRGGAIYGSDFEDDDEKTELSIGLGYQFSAVDFNYAFNLPFQIKKSDGKHFVSLGVSF